MIEGYNISYTVESEDDKYITDEVSIECDSSFFGNPTIFSLENHC